MSHTVVGNCPKCGAPIYSPMAWWGIGPPPVTHTCYCAGASQGTFGTSTLTLPTEVSTELEKARDTIGNLECDVEFWKQSAEGMRAANDALKASIVEAREYAKALAKAADTVAVFLHVHNIKVEWPPFPGWMKEKPEGGAVFECQKCGHRQRTEDPLAVPENDGSGSLRA